MGNPLADICELDKEMSAYSLHYFKELIETGRISEIRPATFGMRNGLTLVPMLWGTAHQPRKYRFWFVTRNAQFEGKSSVVASSPSMISLTILDMQTVRTLPKYKLFPDLSDWEGKILLLETEEKPEPDNFKR